MVLLSYLEFLLIFIVLPIMVLTLVSLYREEENFWWDKNAFAGLMIILFLAVTYTTPWDNLMIEAGVWWYGENATLVHFWEAPLGEYLFFILQPILTAFFLFHIIKTEDMPLQIPVNQRLEGATAGIIVSIIGLTLLLNESTFYMGSILFWSGPILAIQWSFGWPYLWKNKKTVLTAITIPTIYLWIIDAYAIKHGIWVISETYTTGLTIVNLPVEEALFFLVTNVFIVQGLVMYKWVEEQKGVRNYLKELRRSVQGFGRNV